MKYLDDIRKCSEKLSIIFTTIYRKGSWLQQNYDFELMITYQISTLRYGTLMINNYCTCILYGYTYGNFQKMKKKIDMRKKFYIQF